ncbi:hypothetical protein JTB14_010692 [Gonioctena quinquepunctata]|nr:hypothetical protein JTB14_010692 [Gonioctena quinquepunctata]
MFHGGMIALKWNSVYISGQLANLLCFMAGTALTWSSPEIPQLLDIKESPLGRTISPDESSWLSSMPLLGAAICPFLFGYLADKIGRKPTLLFLGIPFFLGYCLLAFGKNVEILYVGRFITGMGVGGIFTVLSMYIGEISEKTNRGILTTSMGCFCCLGMLFSVCLGPFVTVELFNLVLAVPPLIFMVSFFFLASESPLFLVQDSQKVQAKKALERLGRKPDQLELEFIELEASMKDQNVSSNFLDIFRSKALIKGLAISSSLLFFQQFSGINAVLFYSENIFQEAGTALEPEFCTIIVMSIQFMGSFITPCIADRFGRKIILLYSAMGMMISEVPLGIYCYLKNHGYDVETFSSIPVITLTVFIMALNVGFGPLPWTILAELFPPEFKSFATALVSTGIWCLAFAFTKYFEAAVAVFGLGPLFLFFALCSGFAGIFTLFCLIETKGKTLLEIQDILNR